MTYNGSFEMTVSWNSQLTGSDSAELDSVVIQNLRSVTGNRYFVVSGNQVDRIVLAGTVSWSGGAGGVQFTSTTSSDMEVWYRGSPLEPIEAGW